MGITHAALLSFMKNQSYRVAVEHLAAIEWLLAPPMSGSVFFLPIDFMNLTADDSSRVIISGDKRNPCLRNELSTSRSTLKRNNGKKWGHNSYALLCITDTELRMKHQIYRQRHRVVIIR
jgi:hypothetical protein